MLKKIKCCIVELFYFSLKGHRQQLELSLRHLTKILHQPFAYFSMKFIKNKKLPPIKADSLPGTSTN